MYLDILVVAIILICVLKGYRNGFFLEIMSFFGVIVNIILAKNIAPKVVSHIGADPENGFYLIVYAMIFVVTYLVIGLVLMILKMLLKAIPKGSIGMTGGVLFGFFKGIILTFIIVILYSVFSFSAGNESVDKYGSGSMSKKFFIKVLPVFRDYLPESFGEKMDEFSQNEKIEKYIDKALKE